jgi:hypothetical protein
MDDLNITTLATPFVYGSQTLVKKVFETTIKSSFTYSDQKLTASFNQSKLYQDNFSGPGFISGINPGIVTKENIPVSAYLFLIERNSKKVVRSTISNNDGTYIFPNLNTNYTYDIVARDPTRVYNDLIVQDIRP